MVHVFLPQYRCNEACEPCERGSHHECCDHRGCECTHPTDFPKSQNLEELIEEYSPRQQPPAKRKTKARTRPGEPYSKLIITSVDWLQGFA